MLYTGWSLVFSEDDFTVPPHNTETERISGRLELIGTDWSRIGTELPILSIRDANRRPFTRTICLDNLGTSALYGPGT